MLFISSHATHARAASVSTSILPFNTVARTIANSVNFLNSSYVAKTETFSFKTLSYPYSESWILKSLVHFKISFSLKFYISGIVSNSIDTLWSNMLFLILLKYQILILLNMMIFIFLAKIKYFSIFSINLFMHNVVK